MRARRLRFRPSVDFRPGFDLLMPRITPSDIAPFLVMNPTPDNPDTDGSSDPADTTEPSIPPATITTAPTNYVPPGASTTSSPDITVLAPVTSTQTLSTS